MSYSYLEKVLGYKFNDSSLLRLALTHKSYTQDNINCYERLEFLGDAILEMVVSRFLFENCLLPEGMLTKIRANIVCKKTLSKLAEKIGLNKYIIFGNETLRDNQNQSIMADVLEAIIGAIYLDGGIEVAENFIDFIFKEVFERAISGNITYDYKTRLQEIVQTKPNQKIKYNTYSILDNEHFFKSEVYINNIIFGEGKGKKKKEAEQEAAKEAIEKLIGDEM